MTWQTNWLRNQYSLFLFKEFASKKSVFSQGFIFVLESRRGGKRPSPFSAPLRFKGKCCHVRRGFSLAWLLALTKSFSRSVFCSLRPNYATDKRHEALRKCCETSAAGKVVIQYNKTKIWRQVILRHYFLSNSSRKKNVFG